MKKWKLLALISSVILVIAITISLVLIFTYKKEDSPDYTYPSIQPTISNKDEVFLTIGNRGITNEEMYNMSIVTYGLSTLVDLIDMELLNCNNITIAEVNDYKKEIYASVNDINIEDVDLENAEQTATFKEQMTLQGYYTDEDIINAIKLDIARNNYAKEVFSLEKASYQGTSEQPLYFSNEEIEQAISSIDSLKTKVQAILLIFRSESEAIKLMREVGIKVNNTSDYITNWKDNDNNILTKDAIIEKYLLMYNSINSTEIEVNDIPVYTQSDLSAISSTLSNVIFNKLSDINNQSVNNINDCFLRNPNSSYSTNYYYLALRYDTDEKLDVDTYINVINNGTDDEELRDKCQLVTDYLNDNAVSSTYINKVLYQNRLNHGIKIYDERLDLAFYNKVVEALGAEQYIMTTEESNMYVASLSKDVNINITADSLFDSMMKRYGSVVSMQFVNFDIVFNETYSTIYSFQDKKQLKDFDTSFNETILNLKNSLENGDLESYGYSKYYGWENFLRDYGGLTYYYDTIMLGSAYSLALSNYLKSLVKIYNDEANELYDKFIEAFVDKSIDIDDYLASFAEISDDETINTIIYQALLEFNNYYNIKASSISFYVDKIGDTKAHELSDEVKQKGETLLDAIYYLAVNNPSVMIDNPNANEYVKLAKNILDAIKQNKYGRQLTGDTVSERIKSLISIYNISSINDDIFQEYKSLGIRITIQTSKTYNNGNTNDYLKTIFKDLWNDILSNGKNDNVPYFEYPLGPNPKKMELSAVGINEETPYIIDKIESDENIISKIIITDIINTSWYEYYETSDGDIVMNYLPENERLDKLTTYYSLSLISESDRTIEENAQYQSYAPLDFESAFVTNIISVAYQNIISDDKVSSVMNSDRIEKLKSGYVSFTDALFQERTLYLASLLY